MKLFCALVFVPVAYRLPDNEYCNFYDSMTPVNLFRIILNQYFGTDLRVLRGDSYFSTGQNFFKFIDVRKKIASETLSDINIH